VKRKSVTLLNELRLDVERVQSEISDAGTKIDWAATNIGACPANDLVHPEGIMQDSFDTLVKEHRRMGKLLKEFIKARDAYLEFF